MKEKTLSLPPSSLTSLTSPHTSTLTKTSKKKRERNSKKVENVIYIET